MNTDAQNLGLHSIIHTTIMSLTFLQHFNLQFKFKLQLQQLMNDYYLFLLIIGLGLVTAGGFGAIGRWSLRNVRTYVLHLIRTCTTISCDSPAICSAAFSWSVVPHQCNLLVHHIHNFKQPIRMTQITSSKYEFGYCCTVICIKPNDFQCIIDIMILAWYITILFSFYIWEAGIHLDVKK